MPLITFEAAGLTADVKVKLIRELTRTAAEITGIPKESFFMAVRDIPADDIAIGGVTVSELSKKYYADKAAHHAE
jgi:4-oxalocrotonate tautomerase